MKPKIVIIGCGARGGETYGRYFYESGNAQIVALCDTNPERLSAFAKEFNIAEDMCFADVSQLFALGKIADAAVVSNFDREHYAVAMQAMSLGYNLLLEKPISDSIEECTNIRDYAVEHNLKVTVCHVMRYTSYYRHLKEILLSGEIGEIMGIEQTEDVAYWHMAHAFVRGNFRNSDQTSPMILQKCCHDMDLLVYLTDARPLYVTSVGGLRHFRKENAPLGAADRCVNCKVEKCPYNAVDFYVGNYKQLKREGRETNVWPYAQVTVEPTEERLLDALKSGPWGKCVYHTDNNVVDHQFSIVRFKNGLVGTLTMIGFSADGGRQTHVYGTKGEIYLDEQSRTITVQKFGHAKSVVSFDTLATDFSGHGGGDKVMLAEFCESLSTGKTTLNSDIVRSVDSHLMCFAAEQSRKANGIPVYCNNIVLNKK